MFPSIVAASSGRVNDVKLTGEDVRAIQRLYGLKSTEEYLTAQSHQQPPFGT